MIEKNKYGLIICDIKLPNIDGLELFKSVREKLGTTEFVFMSGYVTVDKHMELISQAFAFLQKPFNVNQLMNILNKIFNSGNGS